MVWSYRNASARDRAAALYSLISMIRTRSLLDATGARVASGIDMTRPAIDSLQIGLDCCSCMMEMDAVARPFSMITVSLRTVDYLSVCVSDRDIYG